MHKGKFKQIIIESIIREIAGKIDVGNILSYLEDHTEDFGDLDLVNKKWVLDQLIGIDPTALFFGYFSDEATLLSASTSGVQDGAWALVGTGATFAHYDWDLDAEEWKVITGEKGDAGTVDLGALDLRYLRKDVDDENPNIVTFGKLVLNDTPVEDLDYEYYLGVKPDGSVVRVTPATVDGDKSRYFEITPAGTVWVLDHSMGKRPSYTARDGSGNQIFGTPDWPTLNQMTLTFASSVSGDVALN
jgi:hypothetical protein